MFLPILRRTQIRTTPLTSNARFAAPARAHLRMPAQIGMPGIEMAGYGIGLPSGCSTLGWTQAPVDPAPTPRPPTRRPPRTPGGGSLAF